MPQSFQNLERLTLKIVDLSNPAGNSQTLNWNLNNLCKFTKNLKKLDIEVK